MCVALPMKVLSINNENHTATVQFSGNELEVNITLISPAVGDYVLVHAGCAIEIVKKDMAEEMLEIFCDLQELSGDGH